jgi:hypothetical protein
MKKEKFYLLGGLALALVLVLPGCENPVDGHPVFDAGTKSQGDSFTPAAVYFAGRSNNGLVPSYWKKNGERVDLPVPAGVSDVYTAGMAVVNGSIYVAGVYTLDTVKYPCYWKDGERVDLPLPADRIADKTYLTGMTAANGSVYITGQYRLDGAEAWNKTACYWKDGERVDLPEAGTAAAIFVSEGSVYVAGTRNFRISARSWNTGACYWKDGELVQLDTYASGARDIAVAGGSVYVAGEDFGYACYWKDGERIDLGRERDGDLIRMTKSEALGIAVLDGSVYIAGNWRSNDLLAPCFWKDGERTLLPGASLLLGRSGIGAVDIALVDGSVYVAGADEVDAGDIRLCYWKDGEKFDLPGGTGGWESSGKMSIAVAK